jgi:xanthine dehydrogenase accessory factor
VSDPPADAVDELAPGSAVLIMSHSHAEDFDTVAAVLRRQREHADLPFIGLIGSRTKWASFRQRLQARGFNEPGVIAVAVLAQILALR